MAEGSSMDAQRLAEAAEFFDARSRQSAHTSTQAFESVMATDLSGDTARMALSVPPCPPDPPAPVAYRHDGMVGGDDVSTSAPAHPPSPSRKPPGPPPRIPIMEAVHASNAAPMQHGLSEISGATPVVLKSTVYQPAPAYSGESASAAAVSAPATSTTKLYSFLSRAGGRTSSIEQPDEEDELQSSSQIPGGRDPVPRTRMPDAGGLDMDFEHAQVEESGSLDDDDEPFRVSRHPIPGMDGPIIRGRCVDEVVRVYDTARGLPPTPPSVAAVGGRTHVVARVRPQTALELSEGGMYCLSVSDDATTVTVAGVAGLNRDTLYTLHSVLGPDSEQDDVYATVAHPIVEGVLYGYNGTILAYGQTGSGKTYTTFGAHKENSGIQGELVEGLAGDEAHRGIIPRAIQTLFAGLRTLPPDVHVEVTVSMVEIYQDKIRDLLSTRSAAISAGARGGLSTTGTAFGSSAASSTAAWVASPNAAATTVSLPIPGVSPATALPSRATSPRRSNSFHPATLAVLPIGSQAAAAAVALGSPLAGRGAAPSAYRLRAASGASDAVASAPPERSVSPRGRVEAPSFTPTSPRFNPMRSPTASAASHTYGEEDPDNLSLVVDPVFGVQLCGATNLTVKSESQVLDVLRIGAANRAVAATGMNEESSRSHCIVVLTLLQESAFGVRLEEGATDAGEQEGSQAVVPPAGAKAVRYSKLYFVDLAGSERPNKSKVSGVQLQEAQAINSSLSTLGTVINALANGDPHVPYRDSKLTRLLQDGLGNNSRTALIINVSPSSYNAEETKSSLRFGATAARMRTRPTANMLNPVLLARKETLSRLQRAKSYSSYLRDTQKADAEARSRERVRRETIAKQKMKHLRLTSPEEAMATPAPSNVVIHEATPASPTALATQEEAARNLAAAPGDDTSRPASPRAPRSPRESRTSPDALRALLRHPSAPILLGPAAHHFLKDLAARLAAEDQEKARAEEALRAERELEAAAVIAAAEGLQSYTEDAYGVPITIQVGPAILHEPVSVPHYLQGTALSAAAESHGAQVGGGRHLRRSLSDGSGDVVSSSDILRGWRSAAANTAPPLPPPPTTRSGVLPTIADNEEDDEDAAAATILSSTLEAHGQHTARSSVGAPSGAGLSLARASSASSTSASARLSIVALGTAATAAERMARGSSTGRSSMVPGRGGAAAMPTPLPPVLRVLAPCEIYSVTLTTSPLGFRFFEPETAAHIMPLLPPLSRAKWVSTSVSPPNSGSISVSGASGSLDMGSEVRPVAPNAILPVVETVLPGFPADVLTADASHAVAFAEQFLAAAGLEDEDAGDRMSEERSKGWESRGAIAIGDRLLAVNGIRLDMQPVAPVDASDSVHSASSADSDSAVIATRYADATNRAVKLVKFAMQSLRTRSATTPRGRASSSASGFDASSVGDDSSSVGDTSRGNGCVLTFVSAGPYVRRGIMVGLRLALHHEAHLKKVHEQMVSTAAAAAPQTTAEASIPAAATTVDDVQPPEAGTHENEGTRAANGSDGVSSSSGTASVPLEADVAHTDLQSVTTTEAGKVDDDFSGEGNDALAAPLTQSSLRAHASGDAAASGGAPIGPDVPSVFSSPSVPASKSEHGASAPTTPEASSPASAEDVHEQPREPAAASESAARLKTIEPEGPATVEEVGICGCFGGGSRRRNPRSS